MVLYKVKKYNNDKYYNVMISRLLKSNCEVKKYYADCDIYWLAEPGFFGYRFNPISFWYFVKDDIIQTVLATISNTPWGEEILCEIPKDNITKLWKIMHVSPFNPPRDQYYLFNTNHIRKSEFEQSFINWHLSLHNSDGTFVISADMRLKRSYKPKFLSFNFIIIIIRIYYQAFLLWICNFPVYYHIPIAKN